MKIYTPLITPLVEVSTLRPVSSKLPGLKSSARNSQEGGFSEKYGIAIWYLR